jgi:hypothetical protein
VVALPEDACAVVLLEEVSVGPVARAQIPNQEKSERLSKNAGARLPASNTLAAGESRPGNADAWKLSPLGHSLFSGAGDPQPAHNVSRVPRAYPLDGDNAGEVCPDKTGKKFEGKAAIIDRCSVQAVDAAAAMSLSARRSLVLMVCIGVVYPTQTVVRLSLTRLIHDLFLAPVLNVNYCTLSTLSYNFHVTNASHQTGFSLSALEMTMTIFLESSNNQILS